MTLRTDLVNWRQKATIEIFGEEILKEVGAGICLPDKQLDRMVDCAYMGKINSVEDLRREVGWLLTDEYGPAVVDIIKKYTPPPKEKPPASRPAPRRQPLNSTGRSHNIQPVSKP